MFSRNVPGALLALVVLALGSTSCASLGAARRDARTVALQLAKDDWLRLQERFSRWAELEAAAIEAMVAQINAAETANVDMTEERKLAVLRFARLESASSRWEWIADGMTSAFAALVAGRDAAWLDIDRLMRNARDLLAAVGARASKPLAAPRPTSPMSPTPREASPGV